MHANVKTRKTVSIVAARIEPPNRNWPGSSILEASLWFVVGDLSVAMSNAELYVLARYNSVVGLSCIRVID